MSFLMADGEIDNAIRLWLWSREVCRRQPGTDAEEAFVEAEARLLIAFTRDAPANNDLVYPSFQEFLRKLAADSEESDSGGEA